MTTLEEVLKEQHTVIKEALTTSAKEDPLGFYRTIVIPYMRISSTAETLKTISDTLADIATTLENLNRIQEGT